MSTERILLPVDIRNCPLEAFPLVDKLGGRLGASVTLLHVVTLNILPPESRIYDELVADANTHLKRLGREFLPSVAEPKTRVRIGHLVEELLAETEADKSDLVVIPTHGPSLAERIRAVWNHAQGPPLSRGVSRILRKAGCAVFIVASRNRFDCERKWGRPPSPTTETRAATVKSRSSRDPVSMVVSRKNFKVKYC